MDQIIIFFAKYVVFVVAAIAGVYWLTLNKKHKMQLALTVILAGLAAYALVKISGRLYYHPRPFVAENITPLIPHGNDNSFPSEHATFAMAITTAIFFYKKQLAYGLFLLTVLVCIGRVGAHVHYTTDVIGGLIIGALATKVGHDLTVMKLPDKAKHSAKQSD